MVEFAIVAPLMLIFLVGIVEFGIAVFEYHATDYAAKLGARYASVRGANCTATGCPITSSTLQTYLRSAVPGAGNAVVTASWTLPDSTNYPGIQNVADSCDTSAEQRGCLVTVTVTNTVGINIPFVRIPSNSLTFVATSTVPVTQ